MTRDFVRLDFSPLLRVSQTHKPLSLGFLSSIPAIPVTLLFSGPVSLRKTTVAVPSLKSLFVLVFMFNSQKGRLLYRRKSPNK